MISIEPILDFDLSTLINWIRVANPEFVSIGADSKGCNLPEPEGWKVRELYAQLNNFTQVKLKNNLSRIFNEKEI